MNKKVSNVPTKSWINSGYEIKKLNIVVQGVEESGSKRIVKGVFCGLDIKKDDKEEKINFVFALNSVPEFRKHIISMINQAIGLKINKDKSKKRVTKLKKKIKENVKRTSK